VRRLLFVVFVATALTLPREADAQGRGRPKAPKVSAPAGTASGSPAGSGGEAVAGTAAASAFRQFGVWLDDASGPTAGEGRLGIGAGYWRSTDASLTDVPIVDLSYGVHSRLQLAATVPFYQSNYQGTTFRGLDDMYVSAKAIAIDPAANGRFGVAVTPVLEILSAGYTDDRLHWALPVTVEARFLPVRVYGSAGYFSRGAAFGGAAVEWSTPGPMITVGVTQSFSTTDAPVAAAAGRRSDVSVSVAQALTDSIAGYVSFGRSLSAPAGAATTLGVAGGLSFVFRPASATP
jgi:hypothetical protein